jgi:CBS domain-containing protein
VRDVLLLLDESRHDAVPVVDRDGRLHGLLATDLVRSVLAQNPADGVMIAEDLLMPDIPVLRSDDTLDRALALLALQHVDVLPVLAADGSLQGLLDRRAILGAYRQRIDELRTGVNKQ